MVNPIKFGTVLLFALATVANSQEVAVTPAASDTTPTVVSLTLIGFNGAQDLVELRKLVSGQTLDLSDFNLDKLNVMADVADESKTGSVHFALTGPVAIDRWENNAAYMMAVETDNLSIQNQELPVGSYTLTVTPYALPDMEGQKGVAKAVSFNVTDSKTSGPAVAPIATAEMVVVDEATGSLNTLYRISEGAVINSDDLAHNTVNIVAVSENPSKTGSVFFDLDGPVKVSRYENEAAFTLADKTSHLRGAQDLPEGDYTLIITPFAEADGQGEAGVPLMLNFSIGKATQPEQSAPDETTHNDNVVASVQSETGFTAIRPSVDSKLIYVSSSFGDDHNSCLSEASPCKSIKAGMEKMRSGFPDHLYLKRGDVWRNEQLLGLSSGRSAQEPAVFAYYGFAGARPKIENASAVLHVFQSKLANVHVMGLEFAAAEANSQAMPPKNSGNATIVLWGAGQNILFEDNKFSHITVSIKSWREAKPRNIHLRRNIWIGGAITAAPMPKLSADEPDSVLIEENVFNGGSNPGAEGQDAPTLTVKISGPGNSVTLRKNIMVGTPNEAVLFPGATADSNFITTAKDTRRFNAFLDALTNRPLGFWNDCYSSSAIDDYMQAS